LGVLWNLVFAKTALHRETLSDYYGVCKGGVLEAIPTHQYLRRVSDTNLRIDVVGRGWYQKYILTRGDNQANNNRPLLIAKIRLLTAHCFMTKITTEIQHCTFIRDGIV